MLSRRYCLAALLATTSLARAESDYAFLNTSGYAKAILAASSTEERLGLEGYAVNLNRLRVQLQGQLAPKLALDLQYDNEVLFGSYLDTAQFQLQKSLPSSQYWKSDSYYVDNGKVAGRHRLYRASMTYSMGNMDIKLGRQRIAWGTGRFWSPLDSWNPPAATQLEREERRGVDALLIENKLGQISKLSLAHAPQHDNRNASTAVQFHGNVHKVDYSIVWGKFQQDHVLGFDVATQLGDAGLRCEWTTTRPGIGRAYRRALIGLDYAPATSLTLSAEWYYNGRGTNLADSDSSGQFRGDIQLPGRHYAGLYASYDITPLLKWTNYVVINLSDRSHYFSPTLSYSVRENLEWTVGMQQFGGASGSEYGRMPNFLFSHLKWFF